VKIVRSRRGAGLVDVIVTVMILAATGTIFATVFPASLACSSNAQEYKLATAIAQRKIEQLRTMEYESLTQPLLLAAGVIDNFPTSSPYSFTSVDGVGNLLRQGVGTLSIAEAAADQRLVSVTVSWQAKTGQARTVQLTTLFADRRPRQGS